MDSPSPGIDASAGPYPTRERARAISDDENDEELEGEGEDEGVGEVDDMYGEGDDRCGHRAVHFTQLFDSENALEVDWSDDCR